MARYRCVFIDRKARTIVNVEAEDAMAALTDARCRVVQERLYCRVEVWCAGGLVLASGALEALLRPSVAPEPFSKP